MATGVILRPELDDSAEVVEQEEKKIPVFTVLKNNSILKNIFLVGRPPSPSSSAAISDGVELEEVLTVGRHPTCQITLEHPSISRLHLRIHSVPALQKLYVFDLSSVHGTWVSGKKVEPGVRVELHEGDILQLGGSTRVYRLHWVPLNLAYDMKNPFVTQLGNSEQVDKVQGDARPHLDSDLLHLKDDETDDDYVEGIDILFSDMNMKSPTRQLTPHAPIVFEDTKPSFYSEEDAENNSSSLETLQLSDIAEIQPVKELCERLDSDGLHLQDDETEVQGNHCKDSDLLFPDINLITTPMRQLTPYAPIVLEDTKPSFHSEEGAANNRSFLETPQISDIAEIQPVKELCEGLDSDGLHLQDDETEIQGDYCEGSDINLMTRSTRQLPPYTPLVLEDSEPPFCSQKDAGNNSSFLKTLQPSDDAEIQPVSKFGEELDSDGCRHLQDDETKVQGDYFESLDWLFSDINLMVKPMRQLLPCEEDVENKFSFQETLQQSEIADTQPVCGICEEKFDLELAPLTSAGLSIWKRRGKSSSVEVQTGRYRQNFGKDYTKSEIEVERNKKSSVSRPHSEGLSEAADLVEEIFTPEKENRAPDTHLSNRLLKQQCEKKMKHELHLSYAISSIDEEGEEAFTPDKENMTPNTHFLWSKNKQEMLGKVNHPNTYRSSPLKNVVSNISQEVCIPVPLESANHFREVLEENISDHTSSSIAKSGLKVGENRLPFKSILGSSNKNAMEAVDLEETSTDCKTVGNLQVRAIHPFNSSSKGEIRMWTMVVDTACLLNKESRKALQLMQGLRGTSLIIPRIVIRELDCMNKHCYFFRRNTGVSSALQWIKDCMENTNWWIHVQSSAEDAEPIPPTPRTWPLPHTSNEEKEKFSASSLPFSPFGSFLDIVTPTAEDHVLECALSFRKTLTKGQLVLLSDDVSLKIKAMAEGLLCETAEEFRKSLVNPFSSRFLWTDSSPRGPTWSCHYDVVLREKYCNVPLRKHQRFGEPAKGLKLILLYNSQYRQMSTAK